MVAALVILVMLAGLLGVLLPVLPGLVLIWGAALAYGLIQGFGSEGIVAMIVITILMVLGMVAGFVVPKRATEAAGAAKTSVWIGIFCAAVGFFVIPVFGLFIGGIIGVFLGEHERTGSSREAWATTLATIKGFGLSVLVQFIAGLAMMLTFGVWVLVN